MKTSMFSLIFMTLLLTVLVSWKSSREVGETAFQHRILFEGEDGDPLDVTDDAMRSATCKHYLYEFLNGTTDVHDECEAFKNAKRAAECRGDDSMLEKQTKKNHSGDDDLYIDDWYENFQVSKTLRQAPYGMQYASYISSLFAPVVL